MALITQLTAEEQIPALINIHDVALARRFARRVLGLNQGVLVFEGAPEDLTREALDVIYRGAGEELTSALGA
jgi:phosphonate transport system ATP-binding protein